MLGVDNNKTAGYTSPTSNGVAMTHSADIERIRAEMNRLLPSDAEKITKAAEELSDEFDALAALAEESGIGSLYDNANIPEGK